LVKIVKFPFEAKFPAADHLRGKEKICCWEDLVVLLRMFCTATLFAQVESAADLLPSKRVVWLICHPFKGFLSDFFKAFLYALLTSFLQCLKMVPNDFTYYDFVHVLTPSFSILLVYEYRSG
jgi:hypothetical protein